MAKRLASLFVALVMLFALFAGCAEGGERGNASGDGTVSEGTTKGGAKTGEAGSLSVQEGDKYFRSIKDRIAVQGVTQYYSMARDGEGYRLLAFTGEGYRDISLDKDFREISRRDADYDDIRYLYDAGEGEAPYELRLNKRKYELAQNGEKVCDLPEIGGDAKSVALLPAPEGLYAVNFNFLLLNGKEIRIPTLEHGEKLYALGLLPADSGLFVLLWETGYNRYYLAEVREGKLGEPKETDIRMLFLSSRDGDNGFYFLWDSCLCALEGNTVTKIVDLQEKGLDPDEVIAFWRKGDRFAVVTEKQGISFLEESEEEKPGETVIGCVSGAESMLERLVNDFNFQSRNKARIRAFASEEKMSLALMAGELDLAVSRSYYSTIDRARSGALRPLSELTELEGIYPNLIELGSIDGRCLFLPVSFTLSGTALPESAVGDAAWFRSTEDFEEALSRLPDKTVYSRELRGMALYLIEPEEWVDPEKNTCRFSDESFVRLLQIINRFAPDPDTLEANESEGSFHYHPRVVLDNYYAASSAFVEYEAYVTRHPESGCSVSARYMPVPGTGRYHGLAVEPEQLIAAAAKGQNEEVTREFLAFFFDAKNQKTAYRNLETDYGYLPVIRANEDMIEDIYLGALSREINWGERIRESDLAGLAKEMKRLIADADHYADITSNNELRSVINSEVNRYFAGELTAEKAAEYIQNRISIYLAEQG